MSLRNRELVNLVAVGVLTGLGFASVYIARQHVVSTGSLSYALFFLCVYVAAHVVTRVTVPYADPYLLPIAGLMTAVGVTEIYRIRPGDAFRQGLWLVIAVGLFALTLIALRRDYRRLESYKYIAGLTAIFLLALPVVPGFGSTVNGARLWVHVGGYQFQPGELAKICLVVFLAGYLREKREVLAQGRLKDFGPLLLIWGAAMLVLVETNDLGSALLYFGIFLSMLYVATGRALFVALGLGLFLGGAAVAYSSIARVQERVDCWLHPWQDVHGACYQTAQGLYAIGNGKFGGTGFGRGTFTTTGGTDLIPYVNSDFVYSALAQELGLVGVSAVLLAYM